MRRQDIERLFARFAENNPAPETELIHTNPYTLLVAVVLSAQSTDAGVNRATETLFRIADTPGKMLALGEQRLKAHISRIGLYNTKAKNILALSRRLLDCHGGKVPQDRAALEALPGVGRKTASVVLNCVFGEPAIAVDTHVFRVSNRLGLARAKTPDKMAAALEKIVPARWKPHAHHWLVLHGRYICTARKPRCAECLARDICAYYRVNTVNKPGRGEAGLSSPGGKRKKRPGSPRTSTRREKR